MQYVNDPSSNLLGKNKLSLQFAAAELFFQRVEETSKSIIKNNTSFKHAAKQASLVDVKMSALS